ncbi:MAG: hypothetical protein AAF797_15065 [Planctomycetota bacterium]
MPQTLNWGTFLNRPSTVGTAASRSSRTLSHVRYRFSGLIRETGKPVEGHVTAPDTDVAFAVLADNGIVTSSLRPDPVATPPAGGPLSDLPRDEFTEAIDSAFDLSATDVSVDKLAQKFRGQKVRVVDRDKIRDRVKTVVGNAISAAGKGGNDGQQETLDMVAEALDKMFGDNKNLTSEQPASMVAMEEQIARLMKVTRRIEMAVNRLVAGGGGGGGGNYRYDQRKRSEEQNQVLLEIFQSNKDLRDQIDGKSKPSPPASKTPAPTPPTPAETAG